MEIVVIWSVVTGFLFGFACDSPFNRTKMECVAERQEHNRIFEQHYGHPDRLQK